MKPHLGTMQRWLGHYWPALAVLVCGFGITALISRWLAEEARVHDRARFENEVQLVLNHIESRIEYSVQALGALRDRMSMHPAPDEGVWGVLIDTMKPWINYNGLFEIGFAEFVALKTDRPFSNPEEYRKLLHEERLKVIAQRRKHFGSRFTANTNLCGSPEFYVPVKFHCFNPPSPSRLYPDYGRDLAAEPSVYEALTDVDDNREAASMKVVFDDAADPPVEGFMVVLPVYDLNLRIPLPEITSLRAQPRPGRLDELYFEACRGVVFGSFDLREVVKSSFGSFRPDLDVLIFDREGLHATNRLYGAFDSFVAHSGEKKPYFSTHRELPNYGRRLHFYFQTTPGFEARSHRYRPWLALAMGMLLSCTFAGVTFAQVRGRVKEREIAEELRVSRDQLKLALQERERLSRDLHDGTIQSIYAIGLGLQHCRKIAATNPEKLPEHLAQSVNELNGVIRELREFILILEPELLRGQTVRSVLESYVGQISKSTETKLTLKIDEAVEKLNAQQTVHVLHVIREAVSNALRHGNPKEASIRLDGQNGSVRLEVADDGAGFNLLEQEGKGHGLANMKLRARELHGKFEVISSPNAGTRVVVILPINAEVSSTL